MDARFPDRKNNFGKLAGPARVAALLFLGAENLDPVRDPGQEMKIIILTSYISDENIKKLEYNEFGRRRLLLAPPSSFRTYFWPIKTDILLCYKWKEGEQVVPWLILKLCDWEKNLITLDNIFLIYNAKYIMLNIKFVTKKLIYVFI